MERVEVAQTIQTILNDSLKEELGLQISGFQTPLTGDIMYQIEIDCENSKQLGRVYDIVKEFADERKMQFRASVKLVPDWFQAYFVLVPQGSRL